MINHVQDAILQNSAYTPIHATWPNCKVGNYGDANVDGVNDRTGYFSDWINPYNASNAGCAPDRNSLPPPSSCDSLRVASNMYPRSLVNGDDSCAQMLGTASGRWAALVQYASGDVDSPWLYEVPNDISSAKQAIWYQMPNYYMPASTYILPQACYDAVNFDNPDDADFSLCEIIRHETIMRLRRQEAESVINSGSGMHSDRLVPWLDMFQDHLLSGDHIVEGLQVRNTVAMYRAKNIKEGIFFLSPNADIPAQVSLAQITWTNTADIVERVYASHIQSWARLRGTLPPGSPADSDPTRLEYTLRDAMGNDRTADLKADATGVSELKVTINGLENFIGSPLEINVECSVDQSGVDGMLFALNILNGKWVAVPAVVQQPISDCTSPTQVEYVYRIGTPMFEARRKFFLMASQNVPPGGQQSFVTTQGQMWLKLVHMKPSATSLVTSKYDLVQAIPYVVGCGDFLPPGCGGACPLAVYQSDKNYDTFVDAGDLLAFLDDYAQNKLAADIDNDGDVDVDDLTLYMAYYVNES